MNRKYYAVGNTYGNPTGIGFANTWYALAFSSRVARNAWVDDDSDDMSRRSVRKDEVVGYIRVTGQNAENVPRPFSGEYFGIETDEVEYGNMQDVDGLIGEVAVVSPGDYFNNEPERFYGG